jgi:hypothetical protein
MAEQSSGDDTALIGYKQIAGAQVVTDIAEMPMLEGPEGTINYKQARSIAWLNRRLCDEFLW